MTEAPVRVLIADDDKLVRAGIAGILSSTPDIEVLAEVADGAEALDFVRSTDVDVVLLDIRMPRLDGIRALEQLRSEHLAVPAAMLTTFSDEAYIADAIGLGARGFFLKSDDPRQLISGVLGIAGGGAAFSPRVGRWLIRQEASSRFGRSAQAQSTVRDLAPRQRDMLAGIGRGRSNAQIAKALHLSEGTVKQYVSALFTALGTDNRVQAAIIAHEAGLDDEGDR